MFNQELKKFQTQRSIQCYTRNQHSCQIENYNNEYKFSLTIWYPRKLKGFCNWTFSSLYITKDLNIISCCHKVTNPLIFGNLKNKNLDEILKSEQIINFREKHISNENIPLCNNCPF